MAFIVNFKSNSEFQEVNTRYSYDLHTSTVHLNVHQKGVYYTEIKKYNQLPIRTKSLLTNNTNSIVVSHLLLCRQIRKPYITAHF